MNSKHLLQQTENALQEITVSKILSLNAITEKYGLILTESDAIEIIKTQKRALKNNYRFEFGSDTLSKLIFAFSDSPYLTQSNYLEIIHDLIDLFYHFKSETQEALDDDSLIQLMKDYFDRVCEGSMELLSMKDLETMARQLRQGKLDFSTVRDAHHWYKWEEWND